MLGTQGHWAGRDLYRATPAVTSDETVKTEYKYKEYNYFVIYLQRLINKHVYDQISAFRMIEEDE
jgi:hypothetical protein